MVRRHHREQKRLNGLWSKINMLLKTSESDVATSHTADDFARFFRSKVSNIRRATAVCQRRGGAPIGAGGGGHDPPLFDAKGDGGDIIWE